MMDGGGENSWWKKKIVFWKVIGGKGPFRGFRLEYSFLSFLMLEIFSCWRYSGTVGNVPIPIFQLIWKTAGRAVEFVLLRSFIHSIYPHVFLLKSRPFFGSAGVYATLIYPIQKTFGNGTVPISYHLLWTSESTYGKQLIEENDVWQ